jgi:hypothetical protein
MSNPLSKHYDSDLHAIELHGLTFHIKLPTIANKRFQRAVMSNVATRNENGDFVADDISIEQMVEAQVDAFVRTCIKRADGWPDYSPESLLTETPEAAEELFDKAAEIVERVQSEADASVGKSQAGSNGQSDGEESTTPMPSLKNVAL